MRRAERPPTIMTRRPWITAFIGHILRRGGATDPDTVFHVADSLFLESSHLDPEAVAESTFGAMRLDTLKRKAKQAPA